MLRFIRSYLLFILFSGFSQAFQATTETTLPAPKKVWVCTFPKTDEPAIITFKRVLSDDSICEQALDIDVKRASARLIEILGLKRSLNWQSGQTLKFTSSAMFAKVLSLVFQNDDELLVRFDKSNECFTLGTTSSFVLPEEQVIDLDAQVKQILPGKLKSLLWMLGTAYLSYKLSKRVASLNCFQALLFQFFPKGMNLVMKGRDSLEKNLFTQSYNALWAYVKAQKENHSVEIQAQHAQDFNITLEQYWSLVKWKGLVQCAMFVLLAIGFFKITRSQTNSFLALDKYKFIIGQEFASNPSLNIYFSCNTNNVAILCKAFSEILDNKPCGCKTLLKGAMKVLANTSLFNIMANSTQLICLSSLALPEYRKSAKALAVRNDTLAQDMTVEQVYRKLSPLYHPDKNTSLNEEHQALNRVKLYALADANDYFNKLGMSRVFIRNILPRSFIQTLPPKSKSGTINPTLSTNKDEQADVTMSYPEAKRFFKDRSRDLLNNSTILDRYPRSARALGTKEERPYLALTAEQAYGELKVKLQGEDLVQLEQAYLSLKSNGVYRTQLNLLD